MTVDSWDVIILGVGFLLTPFSLVMLWRKRHAGASYVLAYLAFSLLGLLVVIGVLGNVGRIADRILGFATVALMGFGGWQMGRAVQTDASTSAPPANAPKTDKK